MKKFIILGLCLFTISFSAIAFGNNIKAVSEEETSNVITNKDIYASITLTGGDEKVNHNNTGDLYDFSNVVVVGTVVSKSAATMNSESIFPYTPGTFKVEKVIKGNVSEEVINIEMDGGTCSVETFINASVNMPERVAKMGLNNLSETEKKTKYIEYISPHHKDFEVGKQYVLMLTTMPNDSTYYVLSNAAFLDLNVNTNSRSSALLTIDDINSKEDILNMPNAKFE